MMSSTSPARHIASPSAPVLKQGWKLRVFRDRGTWHRTLEDAVERALLRIAALIRISFTLDGHLLLRPAQSASPSPSQHLSQRPCTTKPSIYPECRSLHRSLPTRSMQALVRTPHSSRRRTDPPHAQQRGRVGEGGAPLTPRIDAPRLPHVVSQLLARSLDTYPQVPGSYMQ